MNGTIRLFRSALAFIVILAGTGLLRAGNTGSLRVDVTDPNGAPIEAASLLLTDPVNACFKMESSTDKRGRADLLGLAPRDYEFQVAKEGFRSYRSNFTAHAGERIERKIALEPLEAGAVVRKEGLHGEEALVVVKGTDERAAAYNEAVRLYDADRNAEALASLESALAQDPAFAPALALKGIILEEEGRCDESTPVLERAVAVDTSLREALPPLIRCLERAGRAAEAAAYREKLSASIRSKTDLYNEAVLRINEGDDGAAAPLLEQAIALDPAFGPAQYQYGLVLFRRGETEEAVNRLERYLQLEPDGEFAADARALLDALAP